MAVPKKRTSKSVRNMRRSHDALTALNFSKCSNCGAPRLPHSVCESCGFYKGRFVAQRYLKTDLVAALR
ncbi:50S ribosomal protein L32 [bacterium]|jgi:large subunit ribosomal protein L32|nr:50S ribosomal protein L32 [bacterium]